MDSNYENLQEKFSNIKLKVKFKSGRDQSVKALKEKQSVLNTISGGSQGEVFKVREKSSGSLYALKRINLTWARANGVNVENEVYCLKHFTNVETDLPFRFVPRQKEDFEDGEFRQIQMELIEGFSLAEVASVSGSMREEQVKWLLAKVLTVIELFHSHGFVHRDLSPSNLILAHTGQLFLVDFGTAQIWDNSRHAARDPVQQDYEPHLKVDGSTNESGRIVGSENQLSPESVEAEYVGRESDLWSQGCLSQQLFTGTNVFQHAADKTKLQENIKHVRYTLAEIDTFKRDLVVGLLQKEPQERLTVDQLKSLTYFEDLSFEKIHECSPLSKLDEVCCQTKERSYSFFKFSAEIVSHSHANNNSHSHANNNSHSLKEPWAEENSHPSLHAHSLSGAATSHSARSTGVPTTNNTITSPEMQQVKSAQENKDMIIFEFKGAKFESRAKDIKDLAEAENTAKESKPLTKQALLHSSQQQIQQSLREKENVLETSMDDVLSIMNRKKIMERISKREFVFWHDRILILDANRLQYMFEEHEGSQAVKKDLPLTASSNVYLYDTNQFYLKNGQRSIAFYSQENNAVQWVMRIQNVINYFNSVEEQ